MSRSEVTDIREAEDSGEESSGGNGRLARLKAAFAGAALAVASPFRRLFGRLRRKSGDEAAEVEEARPVSSRIAEADGVDEEESAPAPRNRRRGLLIYGSVLLAGAAAGGTAAYLMLSKIVLAQSEEIGRQQEEIGKQKTLLTGYEKILVLDHRKLEDHEKALALDLKKLEERQARLVEAEKQLAQLRQDHAASTYRPDQAPSAGNKAQAGATRTGDCELRPGSIGDTLKNCIKEFNRQ